MYIMWCMCAFPWATQWFMWGPSLNRLSSQTTGIFKLVNINVEPPMRSRTASMTDSLPRQGPSDTAAYPRWIPFFPDAEWRTWKSNSPESGRWSWSPDDPAIALAATATDGRAWHTKWQWFNHWWSHFKIYYWLIGLMFEHGSRFRSIWKLLVISIHHWLTLALHLVHA